MLKTRASIYKVLGIFCISLVLMGLNLLKAEATVIDIMFVYDNGASTWVSSNGGMDAFGQDVVNRMNQAMQNSNIDATFRLVHAMTVNTTETDLGVALGNLKSGSGVYAAVHTARNTYGADLVALFIDTGSAYGWVGSGYLLSTWSGSPSYAFTSNAIRSVAISHTLTHEVGHNLGAHHSKYQTSDPGPNTGFTNPTAPYSAGWYFTGTNGTKYHTIMAYNSDGYGNSYTSVSLFSNPQVTYQGVPAGDASNGDNARLIGTTKDIVANYRQGSTTCTYSINPSSANFNANGGTWQVAVTASSSSCSWTATSNASWITINSGSSGTGNGTVYYTVSANTGTSSRTGTITIAGQTHTVNQAGGSSGCTISISPSSAQFPSGGGTGTIGVTTSSSLYQDNPKDEVLVGQYESLYNEMETKYIQRDKLMQMATSGGSVRVIVKLNEPFKPEGLLSNEVQVDSQRSAIARSQEVLLESMRGFNIEGVKRFEYIPYIAFATDINGLMSLYNNPNVVGVYEDKIGAPSLSESVPLIKADEAWGAGYTGSGQVIAILDTGVQSSHPFLTGKVVSEACYSTNNTTYNVTSLCPNGQNEQTGTGAGANCDASISVCGHGTHVTGIAGGSGSSFSGVAKGANIIAIQVFSKFTGTDCTYNGLSSPCTLYYSSDLLRGLERVYSLRNSFNISSVNMSLGGGKYTSQSSCDTDNASMKAAIDNLRSVGIASIIASGNSGYTDGIGAPGCISTAISVGATTKTDQLASYSNSASFLSLLAPGSSINSSKPTNNYGFSSGTSMATPHVAGAWAILKQKSPSATVTEIYQALSNTGTAILDSRNGITKPRINIKAALDSLGGTGTCNWTATSNASWITINSGSSGTGSGTVSYTVAQNTSGKRTGTITVQGGSNAVTHTVTQTDTVFADVDTSMWSANYIVALRNNSITQGCIQQPILFYCPYDTVTRGQMAAFIIRALQRALQWEDINYTETPYYTDVPSGHNFFKYVQKMRDLGITVTTGTYGVNDYVTRGQMAAFIIRALQWALQWEDIKYTETPYYTDVPSGHNFFKYVQKMRDLRITVTTGTYGVNDYVTRQEMAAFLARAFLGMQ